LITIPLIDFKADGICLSTIYQNRALNPWQVYTAQALSLLLKLVGGDICFETATDLDEINTSGELAMALVLKASLFDKSLVNWMAVIDFLPDHLDIIVDNVRPGTYHVPLTVCMLCSLAV
jgi:hypothetical protein